MSHIIMLGWKLFDLGSTIEKIHFAYILYIISSSKCRRKYGSFVICKVVPPWKQGRFPLWIGNNMDFKPLDAYGEMSVCTLRRCL